MGLSTAGASQSRPRKRRGGRRHRAMAEINMTPFIDVVLVLLIVFMVAAPLLTTGVPLDLPQTVAKPLNVEQKPLTLSVDEKGRVFLAEAALRDEDIIAALRAAAKQGEEERIYLRGSKLVDYGRIAQVMSIVTSAGFKKVALVTEPDKG